MAFLFEAELSEQERAALVVYCEKLLALFARVDARQPEKGIETLAKRALKNTRAGHGLFEENLEIEYQAAVIRTERRIQLLTQCVLPSPDER